MGNHSIKYFYTLQRERLMNLYPRDYQEHLSVSNHVSEKSIYISKYYPHLTLNIDKTNEDKIFHEINLFFLKK